MDRHGSMQTLGGSKIIAERRVNRVHDFLPWNYASQLPDA
jgi:hypothetical protein